jgi:hypothetical protein
MFAGPVFGNNWIFRRDFRHTLNWQILFALVCTNLYRIQSTNVFPVGSSAQALRCRDHSVCCPPRRQLNDTDKLYWICNCSCMHFPKLDNVLVLCRSIKRTYKKRMQILIIKPEGNRALGKSRHRWKDNPVRYLKETWRELRLIHLPHYKDRCLAVVKTVCSLAGNFFASWATVSFSWRTLFHGINWKRDLLSVVILSVLFFNFALEYAISRV